MHERRLRAFLAGGLQHVECADGVGVEIVEGNGGCVVVGWLGCGVDNGVWPHRFHQSEHTCAVADINFMVNEVGELDGEAVLVPAGIPLRAEENGALVVVHAVDSITELA
jgi:hypothetical protein